MNVYLGTVVLVDSALCVDNALSVVDWSGLFYSALTAAALDWPCH